MPYRSSKFKIETSLLQTSISWFIEAVKAGGAMSDVFLNFVRVGEQFHAHDFFSEISLIKCLGQDCFIKPLKFRERKFLWQQLKTDRLVADFSFQAFQRNCDDLVVIEREWREICDSEPS